MKDFQRIRYTLDKSLNALKYGIYKIRLLLATKTIEPTHRRAMIFAPHQDDESLGCGGTIALKRAFNIPVKIVYITGGQNGQIARDGRESMPANRLTTTRNKEALDALDILGVRPEDVTFLNYMDGGLHAIDSATRAEITSKMSALLFAFKPEEVYVTYRSDGHKDHEATYLLVNEAINQSKLSVDILEYPVWSIYYPHLKFKKTEFKNFYRLPIHKVREKKIASIACFHSQLFPVGGLNKTFVKRLSSPYEFFIKTQTLP